MNFQDSTAINSTPHPNGFGSRLLDRLKRIVYTAAGLLACLLWASGIAFTREESQAIPGVTSAAANFMLAGLFGFLFIFIKSTWASWTRSKTDIDRNPDVFGFTSPIPWKYTIVNGILFTVNSFSYGLSIVLSNSNEVVVEASMIGYLWPCLTVACTVFALKLPTRWVVVFPLGLCFALVGVFFVSSGPDFSLQHFLTSVFRDPLPYLFAFVSASTWPFYSVLCQKWAEDSRPFHVPSFMFSGGVSLFILSLVLGEYKQYRPLSLLVTVEMLYVALVLNCLSYTLWEMSMAKGNAVLVTSFATLGPLLSAVISTLLLDVEFTLNIGIGAVFIVLGAIFCEISVVSPSATRKDATESEPFLVGEQDSGHYGTVEQQI